MDPIPYLNVLTRGSRLSVKKTHDLAGPQPLVSPHPIEHEASATRYPFEFRVVLQGGKVCRDDPVRLE